MQKKILHFVRIEPIDFVENLENSYMHWYLHNILIQYTQKKFWKRQNKNLLQRVKYKMPKDKTVRWCHFGREAVRKYIRFLGQKNYPREAVCCLQKGCNLISCSTNQQISFCTLYKKLVFFWKLQNSKCRSTRDANASRKMET